MADQFNPDAYLAAQQGATSAPQTAPSVPVDQIQLQQFDPNAYLQNKQTANVDIQQQAHGGVGSQILAGIEGVARGRTVGLSDAAETALASPTGLLGQYAPGLAKEFTPEAIKGRQEANPITSGLGTTLGGAMLAPGLGAAAGAAGLTGIAAESAVGAAYGAGNVISDLSLGDPEMNAQKVIANIGFGAVLGAGLGLVSKGIQAIPALMRKSTAAAAAQTIESAKIPPSEGGPPIVDLPKDQYIKPAQSLDEIAARTEQAIKYGGQEGVEALPQKPEYLEAMGRIGQEMGDAWIPNQYQIDSLNSLSDRNIYQSRINLPGKIGKVFQDFERGQGKRLINMLDNTIEGIAPGYEPTDNAQVGGERAAKALTDKIQSVRDEIGPMIGELKKTPINEVNHLPGVIDSMTRADPKIADMFDTAGTQIKIKPYSTAMGIEQTTYRTIKQAVEALKENPTDVESLFNIRKNMSQNIDLTKAGDASSQITTAKKAFLDYIQDAIQEVTPDVNVRSTMAQYAKNEQLVPFIEKTVGARIGDNWRSLALHKPEEQILNKIFSNSESVSAFKEILGQEEFNKLLADHMKIMRSNMTNANKEFSAKNFFNNVFAKAKQYPISEAFIGKEGELQKIRDITTLARPLADNINPAGTAKTFMQGMIDSGFNIGKQAELIGSHIGHFFKEKAEYAAINSELAGQQAQNSKLASIRAMANRVTDNITKEAKGIFDSPRLKGGILAATTSMSDKQYDEITNRLKELSSNPQTMMDHMANSTEGLHQAAPSISQSLQSSMVQGVQFLMGKIPVAPSQQLLSAQWKPSAAQKTTFSNYYKAVNEPINALKNVANGSLNNQTMEALQAVHPKLLSEMQQHVINHMKVEKAKEFNYAKKLSLAKFLGQPLDGNMLPQSIQANQMALNPPIAPAPQAIKGSGKAKALKQSTRVETQTSRKADED